MGIKDLWTVLNPYCERKPLYELQGKVVAIDLAGWICESLCVVDYEVQARNYLRNLFFRTCYLLLTGVIPVFVLEGEAPALKYDMISKRNEIQFRGARPRKEKEPATGGSGSGSEEPKKGTANKGRSRFNYVLKQCEDLLRTMGLQCVKGPGEAEAFCSHLNAAGLVDGVISQDSDCFAYGAIRVYRNFSVSTQGSVSAAGGAVDVYDMDVVRQTFDIGQNKTIAMALLCGCDYCPEGVGGVGKDAVTKLFNIYSDAEILDRMKAWRTIDHKYTSLELKVNDKTICVNCGHFGRSQNHARNGCDLCRTHVGCDESKWKEQRISIKMELQIRKKCIEIADFPSTKIIDEFKQKPIEMTNLNLDWQQPSIIKFLRMMSKLLQWQELYCFQKILPILTRWQLFNYSQGNQNIPMRGVVWPDFIKKKRAPKGIASYEIIWKDDQNCFAGLIPDAQLETYLSGDNFKNETDALHSLWSTIEPIDSVEKAYPSLVETFLNSKAKKPKATKKPVVGESAATRKATKRGKNAANRSLQDMTKLQDAINELSAPDSGKKQIPTKKKRNPQKKLPTDDGLQTLDKFFAPNKPTDGKQMKEQQEITANIPISVPNGSSKTNVCSMPMNLSKFDFDSDESFGDDSNGKNKENISQVIKEIVSRAPNMSEFAGKQLRFDQVNVKKLYEESLDENAAATEIFQPNESNDRNFQLSFTEYRATESDLDDCIIENIHCVPPSRQPTDIDTVDLCTSKTTAADASFDEFDLLVMKQSPGVNVKGLNPLNSFNLPVNKAILSSTPVLVNRFLTRHNLSSQHNLDARKAINLTTNTDETIKESSFFCTIREDSDEMDAFEQSIDFKNMDDADLDSD